MAITECSVCGRCADSRSMQPCAQCGVMLCVDCAKTNRNHCTECTDGEDSYDGR